MFYAHCFPENIHRWPHCCVLLQKLSYSTESKCQVFCPESVGGVLDWLYVGTMYCQYVGTIYGKYSQYFKVLYCVYCVHSTCFTVRYCGYCLYSGLFNAHTPSTRSISALSTAHTPSTRSIRPPVLQYSEYLEYEMQSILPSLIGVSSILGAYVDSRWYLV